MEFEIYSSEKASGVIASKAKTHQPVIEAPEKVRVGEPFEIKVKVGPHPSTKEHYIGKIDVYYSESRRDFNPILIASIILAPEYTEPTFSLKLKVEKHGVIHVISYCNLHGLWRSWREIHVE